MCIKQFNGAVSVNMALPTFVDDCLCLLSVDIVYPQCAQQQTHFKLLLLLIDGTEEWMTDVQVSH